MNGYGVVMELNLPGFLKNPYVATIVCFLSIPVAIGLILAIPQFPHVGMLVVLIAALAAKCVENRALKVICYLSLGFVSFWAAGNALFVPVGQEAQLFSFIPFVILGIANATAGIVAYNDGYMNGIIFASASLVAILFTKGPLDTGSVDRFFITALIFSSATVVFVLFASWTNGLKNGIYNSFKAAIVAGFIYGFIYVLRVFDISMLNFSDMTEAMSKISPVQMNIWWAALVSNFFVMAIVFCAYELVLYLFNLVRVVRGDGGVLLMKEGSDAAAEEDPFEPLRVQAEKFFEDFSTYDTEGAAKVLGEMEIRYSMLARKKESPMKAKVGRMLMEARGLLLGTRFEVATKQVPVAARAGPAGKRSAYSAIEPFEVPKGAVVLVEGPIGSRKEEFCLDMMKAHLAEKEKCMIVSFEPEREAGYLGEDKLLMQVKVEQNLNDIALSVSRALEDRPSFMFLNILYCLVPNYNTNTVSDFLSSTIKKLKRAEVTGIFVMEEEMLSPQVLSTMESLFDGVVEFATEEEGGRPRSKYRVKEFKFKKFDASWREYG